MKLSSAISTLLLGAATTISTSTAQLTCPPSTDDAWKTATVPYGDGTSDWGSDAWTGDDWAGDGYGKPSFTYAIVHDGNETAVTPEPSIMCARMETSQLGFIAFGISPAGTMIGAEAIIGLPDANTVLKYNLGGKAVDLVTPMPSEKQTLLSSSITQTIGATNNSTILEFTKLLVEEGEHPIVPNQPNTFLWALGTSNELGYHGGDKSVFVVTLDDGTLTAAPTPGPLVVEDSIDIMSVGYPTLEGSSVEGEAEGDWQVMGSGHDIWGSYDYFHYMYFNQTGDVTVTCLVNSFTGSTNSWRKGGIMFRANTGQRAAHSMIQLTGWGVAHQSRLAENHGSMSAHDSYDTSNVWLRLVKVGDVITAYVKKDGEYDFKLYNTVEGVELGTDFKVGIAVTSHDNSQLATLDISHLDITNEVYTPMGEFSPTEIGDTGAKLWIQQTGEGEWAIQAAGDGIGGTSDSFGFLDQEKTGDIVAELHLENLKRRTNDSKGGLMIRASHDVDAPHVSLLVNSGTGVTMYSRATPGGQTTSKNVGVWLEDVELRLEKTGNTVKCLYKHASAIAWYELGEATVELQANGTDTYFVGQAVSSAEKYYHATLTTGLVNISPMAGEL